MSATKMSWDSKEKKYVYDKKQYQKNKKMLQAKSREYAKTHRSQRKETQRRLHLKKTYNLTLEQVDEILIKQNHRCAICENSLRESRRCIDHDHKTGEVRGILCNPCNIGLANFRDNVHSLLNAIAYIKYTNRKEKSDVKT
jgi:hypothetical protein